MIAVAAVMSTTATGQRAIPQARSSTWLWIETPME